MKMHQQQYSEKKMFFHAIDRIFLQCPNGMCNKINYVVHMVSRHSENKKQQQNSL